MMNCSPAFRGSYMLPYTKLMEMQQKSPDKLEAFGNETAEIAMQGGNVEQKEEGLVVTVPFEKEQEYAAVLAKYGVDATKVN